MRSPENALTVTLSLPEAFALACKADGPLVVHATHRTSGETKTQTLDSAFAFLGRAQVVGVRLDDPTVSQCHAYVQVVEGTPYCIDLGSRTGVVWSDGGQARGWVEPGHTLRIGMFDVRIRTANAAEPPMAHSDHDVPGGPALSSASLEIHSPAHPGTLHSLDRPITLIGRHPGCDLRLMDESASYFQCAVVNTPDGAWYVDIPNRKSAALNGRLTRLARLRDGDLLEVGRVSLVVRTRPPSAAQVVVGNTSLAPVGGDPVAAVSTKVAEGVVGAMAPFREMMTQFQQCFVTMAQMFATMQQEHSAIVSEQMRQMQDLARELKEFRAEVRRDAATRTAHAVPPPPPPPPQQPQPATEAPRPTPTVKMTTNGTEAQTLTDAHAWFLGRMSNKGQTPPAGS